MPLFTAGLAGAQTQPYYGGAPAPAPAPAPTYTPAPVQVAPGTAPEYQPQPQPGQPAPPPAPYTPPPGPAGQYPAQQPQQAPYPQQPGAQPMYPAQQPQPGAPPMQYPAPQGPQPMYTAPPPVERQAPPPQSDGRKDLMFKGALRIGSLIPMGNLVDSPDGALSDNVSNQTLVTFDLGLRYKAWFFGIFLGLGGGSVKGPGAAAIEQAGFSNPTSFVFQLGPEVHYNFYDEGPIRPWVGLGLGLDALIAGASNGGTRYSESYTTFTPFRPMLGVDWLITKGFGLGLYVDWQIATYKSVHTSITPPDDPTTPQNESVTNAVDQDIDITNTAAHEWLGLGVRAILFP